MKKIIKRLDITIPALCAAVFMLFGCTNTLAEDSYVQPTDWSEGVMATDAWVMAGVGISQTVYSDALHLAYSEDGLTWTALNSNARVFTPTIGSGHIRDPYIFRQNDGTFVLLAADYTEDGQYYDMGSLYELTYGDNPSNCIYVAFSDDLITWKNEHLLQVTNGEGTDGDERHAWTPRAIYNKSDLCYDIYWTGDDSDGVNHVYVTQTYDFISVHDLDSHIIYSPGYSVTGAGIVKANSKYYLFARDADIDYATGEGGDIQAAVLDTWGDGAFSLLSGTYCNRGDDQDTPVYVENPCVYELEDGVTWIMIAQESNYAGTYQTLSTTDISSSGSWEEITTLTLPETVCASVTRITADELEALEAAY